MWIYFLFDFNLKFPLGIDWLTLRYVADIHFLTFSMLLPGAQHARSLLRLWLQFRRWRAPASFHRPCALHPDFVDPCGQGTLLKGHCLNVLFSTTSSFSRGYVVLLLCCDVLWFFIRWWRFGWLSTPGPMSLQVSLRTTVKIWDVTNNPPQFLL